MSNNYPMGVTGNEPELTGGQDMCLVCDVQEIEIWTKGGGSCMDCFFQWILDVTGVNLKESDCGKCIKIIKEVE